MSYQLVCGQTNPGNRFFKTDSKSHLYYADLNEVSAQVYSMGRYYGKVGIGYDIMRTTTLQRQPDSSYSDGHFRIVHQNEGFYLIEMFGKDRRFRLHAVKDTNLVNNHLNNALYYGSYFFMCKKLNHRYPLNYLSYGDAYSAWKRLPENEKNMNHLQFSALIDKRFEEISDSISAVQERYVRLKNDILENFRSWDYAALKDSLARLPAEYRYRNTYYGTVLDTLALEQPEYILRLAEDLPEHKPVIFRCGIENKSTFSKLMNVEGHDESKKELIKARRGERLLGYYTIGSTALNIGLLVLLGVAIF